ncbi:MAG: phosphotransferase [Shinella sp.]|nr:MAG: phosphotransferase [Shinella sp.]
MTQAIELPVVLTEVEFERWMGKPEHWLALANRIADMEGFTPSVMELFGNSTNLVVNLDDRHILKVFPPMYESQFSSERNALRFLKGQLEIAVPSIKSEGNANGWHWLITTKLDGIVGSMAWPLLSETAKESVLEQIGAAIAHMQKLPVDNLVLQRPSWHDFVRKQLENCFEHHRQLGMAHNFLADLKLIIEDAPTIIPLDLQPVLLTGDWIPQNMFLTERNGKWKLTGVIDFGDVMTGWGEYDLLAPNAFMCSGEPDRTQALLRGYGVPNGICDTAMRRRLLTLALLHAESDISKIDIDSWQHRANSLFDLGSISWP